MNYTFPVFCFLSELMDLSPPPSTTLHHPSSPSWCGVLFMINRDNSGLWCHLLWLLRLRATRSSYWLSARPALHFVSLSGSPRDRRARQSYKVKCLGLAPALQVSVIILLEAFLLCWIIMEVGVVGLSPLKCGWRKQTRAAEKCLLCCYAIWGAWHQSKAALCPARRAGFTAGSPTSLCLIYFMCVRVCECVWLGGGEAYSTSQNLFHRLWCDNETCSLKVIMCLRSSVITECQARVIDKQICSKTRWWYLSGASDWCWLHLQRPSQSFFFFFYFLSCQILPQEGEFWILFISLFRCSLLLHQFFCHLKVSSAAWKKRCGGENTML